MTKPLLAINKNGSIDIHYNGKASSGYARVSESYSPLRNIVKAWRDNPDFWSQAMYEKYKEGYYPIMTLEMVIWDD